MGSDLRDNMDKDEPVEPRYAVKLDRIFEGPMDLLIHLIQKNEVDIYDIPIALITDQFLAYIALLKSLNVDLAGDFIVMAATLTHIKSKMLLPVHDEETEAEEDPRLEITRPLVEYLEMKAAAEALGRRSLLGEHIFARPRSTPETTAVNIESDIEPETLQIGLFELIDAFQKILDRIPQDHCIDLTEERISIKDRISEIIDLLEEKSTLTLDELWDPNAGKREVILTFLAVLEMVKLSLVTVAQHAQSGIVRLFYQ